MNTEKAPGAGEEFVSWLIAFALITLGLAMVLVAAGVKGELTLAWALLSWGTLAIFETGGIVSLARLLARTSSREQVLNGKDPASAPPPAAPAAPAADVQVPAGTANLEQSSSAAPVKQQDDATGSGDVAVHRTGRLRRLLEVALALLLAVGALVVSRAVGYPATGNGGLARFSDEDRALLRACGEHRCTPAVSGTVGQEPNLHLSPAIEDALLRLVRDGGKPPDRGAGLPVGGSLPLVLLLAIAAGIGLLLWATRKHPATAAPLGAAALAAAAIKNPESLSRLGGATYWSLLVLFCLVVLLLVTLSFVQATRSSVVDVSTRDVSTRSDTAGSKSESKVVESPLNVILSVAILLWALLIVCGHEAPKVPDVRGPSPPRLSYTPLGPITGFPPYSADLGRLPGPARDAVHDLARTMSAAPLGDLLLLLGSADCTAIQRAKPLTNADLARKRADALRTSLIGDSHINAGSLYAESLHQHQHCSQSADLRGVFPVLVHATP